MNSAFWRYMLILSLLYIIWGEFFVSGGVLNILAFNFAIFYALGFFAGVRPRDEKKLQSVYLAGYSFNSLSYLLGSISGIPIESWILVVIDFVSVALFLKAGMFMGQRTLSEEGNS